MDRRQPVYRPGQDTKKQAIGTRYMRTALHLEPDDCTVKQWPVHWLSSEENKVLHPAAYAWQITVPVEAARLEEAATKVANQWKEQAVPFRFIGTTPTMHGTGCRVSVLRAIEQGREPEAKALSIIIMLALQSRNPRPRSQTE